MQKSIIFQQLSKEHPRGIQKTILEREIKIKVNNYGGAKKEQKIKTQRAKRRWTLKRKLDFWEGCQIANVFYAFYGLSQGRFFYEIKLSELEQKF